MPSTIFQPQSGPPRHHGEPNPEHGVNNMLQATDLNTMAALADHPKAERDPHAVIDRFAELFLMANIGARRSDAQIINLLSRKRRDATVHRGSKLLEKTNHFIACKNFRASPTKA
jgi:hypothetical protein